jgi:hypothetical protein
MFLAERTVLLCPALLGLLGDTSSMESILHFTATEKIVVAIVGKPEL